MLIVGHMRLGMSLFLNEGRNVLLTSQIPKWHHSTRNAPPYLQHPTHTHNLPQSVALGQLIVACIIVETKIGYAGLAGIEWRLKSLERLKTRRKRTTTNHSSFEAIGYRSLRTTVDGLV